VHIWTADGQHPIVVPMYSSLPEIERQLKAWFQQEVITPSISLWSAPMVIAY
ncbi:hypothetical protein HYDPIDRAFT_101257, partial [Hydnomerulius pinastri MD-312]